MEKGKINIYIGRNSSGKSNTIDSYLKKMDKFIKDFDDPSKMDDLSKVTSFLHKKLIDKLSNELKISEKEKNKINTKFTNLNKEILDLFNENDYDNIIIQKSLGKGIGVSDTASIREFEFLDSNYELGNGHKFFRLLILMIYGFNTDPLKDFAMDEPERFLHRELQIKLCKLLNEMANKGTNIHIATHSEIIADRLSKSLEDINLVNKFEVINGDIKQNFKVSDKHINFNEIFELKDFWNIIKELNRKGMVDKISKRNYFDKNNEINEEIIKKFINDFFKVEIIKACFANKVILVEGIIEKEILERNTDYFVINSYGKINVIILSYLMKQLNINFIGIIDHDKNDWSLLNAFGENIKILKSENIEKELNMGKYRKGIETSFHISTRKQYIPAGSEEPISIEKEINNFLSWIEEKFNENNLFKLQVNSEQISEKLSKKL